MEPAGCCVLWTKLAKSWEWAAHHVTCVNSGRVSVVSVASIYGSCPPAAGCSVSRQSPNPPNPKNWKIRDHMPCRLGSFAYGIATRRLFETVELNCPLVCKQFASFEYLNYLDCLQHSPEIALDLERNWIEFKWINLMNVQKLNRKNYAKVLEKSEKLLRTSSIFINRLNLILSNFK